MKTTDLLVVTLALLVGWPARAANMPVAEELLQEAGVSAGLAVVVGTTDGALEVEPAKREPSEPTGGTLSSSEVRR